MKAWFQALSERERSLVLVGGFLLLAMMAYFYGWKPLQRYKADMERDISLTLEDRQFLNEAKRQVTELEQSKKSKRVIDTSTSVQILANPLLKRYRLDKKEVLVRSEAKSKDAVSLKLENAPFDMLIRFIGDMERQNNIKVSSMALIPSKTVGLTGAQFTLERWKKQLFWLFAGLCSFTVSLVALAPLPVVAQQIVKMKPDLKLAGVSGSLWKGSVQRITTPQVVVNDFNWTFAPKKLLSGYLAVDMQAEVKTVQLRGECGLSVMQNLHCSPLRAEMDAANLHQLTPPGKRIPAMLGGNFIANLDDITWDREQIPVANGRLLWDDGKVDNPIKLDLGGRYRADIEGDKDGNALTIELLSEETSVVLSGDITVEPEGEYRLEVFVKPSGTADPSIGAALEFIGAPQNDGSVRIQQKGMLLPAKKCE